MVREIKHSSGPDCRFLIRPNRSLTWRQALAVYCAISAVALGVGTGFLLVGLPLVLPYSGLEVIGLGAALHISLRRTRREQCIEICGDLVLVAKRAAGGADAGTYEFQRAWARVVLERDRNGWYPSRLKLRSHGREVEIGEFLAEDERLALRARLAAVLGPGPAPVPAV